MPLRLFKKKQLVQNLKKWQEIYTTVFNGRNLTNVTSLVHLANWKRIQVTLVFILLNWSRPSWQTSYYQNETRQNKNFSSTNVIKKWWLIILITLHVNWPKVVQPIRFVWQDKQKKGNPAKHLFTAANNASPVLFQLFLPSCLYFWLFFSHRLGVQ